MFRATRLVSLLRLGPRPLMTIQIDSTRPASSFSSSAKQKRLPRALTEPGHRRDAKAGTKLKTPPEPPAASKQLSSNAGKPERKSADQHRISMTQIREIVQTASKESDTGSRMKELLVALELLGSTTETSSRDEFQQMIDLIWSLKDSATMDISFYNAYLNAKVHGGLDLRLERCLGELTQYGLSPDVMTLQCFVEHFCECGQVDRALEVVSNLRTQDLTRGMYHSLLKGYLKSGDADKARNILSRMREQNIEPNSETYTVLARGLAARGENAGVLDAVQEGGLSSEQLFSLFSSATDIDLIERLGAQISQSEWSPADAEALCLELIRARKLKQARLISEKLLSHESAQQFFPIHMIMSGYSAEEVVDFCQSFPSYLTRRHAWQASVEATVSCLDVVNALKYLGVYRASDFPVLGNHFHPLISRARDVEEVETIIMQMLSWKIAVSETTLYHVFSKLLGEWSIEPQDALSRLKRVKISEYAANSAMVSYYISTKQFDECIRLFEMFDPWIWEKNVQLIARNTTPENQDSSSILIKKISNRSESPKKHRALVNEYQRHLGARVSSANIKEPATGLTYSQPPNKWLRDEKMNSQEDLTHLLDACSRDDPGSVDRALEVLDQRTLEPPSLFSLINFYTRNGDLERAQHYFDQVLQKTEPDRIGDWIVLGLATVMIEHGKYDEARSFLRDYPISNNFKLADQKAGKASALFKATLENVGFDAALDLIWELVPKLLPIEPGALLPIVLYALEHRPERISEYLLKFAKQFGIAPGLLQVYRYLISTGRESELRELYEVATELHGRKGSTLFLAYAYIQERNIPMAKKYLMSMNFESAQLFQMKQWCENSLKKRSIDDVEVSVDVLLQCGISCDSLYFLLARAYADTGDVRKASELWEKVQEYNASISTETLQRINIIFRRKGLEAPFPLRT